MAGDRFQDNVCSTNVIAPKEKLNDCSKYESAFCRPIQKSASIRLICSVKMSDLKIYLRCFDFILKSGTFCDPRMVLPGRGQHDTNPGHPGKSGTGGKPTYTSTRQNNKTVKSL